MRILFTSADTYTPRATTFGVSPRSSARRCNFIAESRVSRQAARAPSDLPKIAHESDFCFPRVLPRIISNVKHCNLNMDKARRVRAISRYQSKCKCNTRMYTSSSGLCVLSQLLAVRNRRCCRNRKFENSKSESRI